MAWHFEASLLLESPLLFKYRRCCCRCCLVRGEFQGACEDGYGYNALLLSVSISLKGTHKMKKYVKV